MGKRRRQTALARAAEVESASDDLDRYLDEQFENQQFLEAYEDAGVRERLLRSLLEARHQAQLTQSAVADGMGTTQSAVSELEGGLADARLSTLQRYARAVSCRIAAWVVPSQGADAAFAAFVNSETPRLPQWSDQLPNSVERTVRGQVISLQIVAVAPAIGVPTPEWYFAGRFRPSGQEGSTLQGSSYSQIDRTEPIDETFTIRKVTA
jgi:transcriptional regulator with XRE-family HTH domain